MGRLHGSCRKISTHSQTGFFSKTEISTRVPSGRPYGLVCRRPHRVFSQHFSRFYPKTAPQCICCSYYFHSGLVATPHRTQRHAAATDYYRWPQWCVCPARDRQSLGGWKRGTHSAQHEWRPDLGAADPAARFASTTRRSAANGAAKRLLQFVITRRGSSRGKGGKRATGYYKPHCGPKPDHLRGAIHS